MAKKNISTDSSALEVLRGLVGDNRYVRSLNNRLRSAIESVCLLVQGDSTGNDGDEWVYALALYLKNKYPAYTLDYAVYNPTAEEYNEPQRVQVGANGEGYVVFDNAPTTNVSTPDAAKFDITGDIDISAKIALDNWTAAGAKSIVSKFGDGGNRGYNFSVNPGGGLYLWYSTDGTANATIGSTIALPFVNGEDLWVRVTCDVDNGSGGNETKFYYSENGSSWTQLGDTIVGVGTLSFYANTDPLYLGTRSGSDTWNGKLYKAIIRNGINGTIVASPDFGMVANGVSSFKDIQGNVWTCNGNCITGNGSPILMILNSSVSGATISYMSDVTRFAQMTPIDPQLSFISLSHNQGASVDIFTEYEALCSMLTIKYPYAGIVCIAQNPELNTATNWKQHAIRCSQIGMIAAKNNYGFVDVFTAFNRTNLENLMLDEFHPNSDGSILWKDEVVKFLSPLL